MNNPTCPSCGSPLKPGVRFCGSCGKPVPASTPPPARPVSAMQQMVACPHCGNPVRVGAKFCSACGKTIEQVQPVSKPVAAPAGVPAGSAPPTAAAPARTAPTGAPSGKKAHRKGAALWIVIALFFICLLSAAGGAFLWFDPLSLDLFGGPTAIATLSPTTSISAPTTPSGSPTLPPTDTIIPPTDTPAPTSASTETATLTPVPPTMESNAAPTLPSPGGDIILQEGFDEAFPGSWILWGEPAVAISQRPGNRRAEFTGEVATAGITSQPPFIIGEEWNLQFNTMLLEGGPANPLVFDLDLGDSVRQPGQGPGFIHIVIEANEASVQVQPSVAPCATELTAQPEHTVLIRVLNLQQIIVAVDGKTFCTLDDISFEIASARLSFSGAGLLDDVTVWRP